jgi:DNA invertase Pin-like site-specific DNA recombinase
MTDLFSNTPSKIFAYARVSTQDQKNDRQLVDLKNHGYDELFEEKGSGMTTKRPALQAMIDKLRQGDTVVVSSYDRLGRSTKDLLNMIELFHTKGVNFVSLYEKVDTSTAIGKLYFTIASGFAEFEASRMRERTIAGLRASNKKGGRPKGQSKETQQKCLSAYTDYMTSKTVSMERVLKINGVSRTAYYRWLHENKKIASPETQVDAFFER